MIVVHFTLLPHSWRPRLCRCTLQGQQPPVLYSRNDKAYGWEVRTGLHLWHLEKNSRQCAGRSANAGWIPCWSVPRCLMAGLTSHLQQYADQGCQPVLLPVAGRMICQQSTCSAGGMSTTLATQGQAGTEHSSSRSRSRPRVKTGDFLFQKTVATALLLQTSDAGDSQVYAGLYVS